MDASTETTVVSIITKPTIETEKEFQGVFVKLDKSIHDSISNAMRSLVPQFVKSIQKTIASKGANGGNPAWKIGKNPRPLVDTLALFRSFKGEVQDQGDHFTLVIGTDKDYAEDLDKGATVKTDVFFDRTRQKSGTNSLWFHALEYYKGYKPNDEAAQERHDRFISWVSNRTIKIPPRPFMFLTDEDQRNANETIQYALAAINFERGEGVSM